jgi:hypothetical protein
MVVLAQFVPEFWRINTFIAMFPLGMVVSAHFLMPIALNPGLMKFQF